LLATDICWYLVKRSSKKLDGEDLMKFLRSMPSLLSFGSALFLGTQASAADSGLLSMWDAVANATTWQVATGVDYSVGRYGQASDTTVISVPLNAAVQIDRLRLELTIPYLDVHGPGAFVGGVVIPGGGGPATNSGLGDINLGAAWLVHRDDDSFPAVEVAGMVKLPTASSGLGTGKWDYSVGLNLYHSFSPQLMVFGSVGYSWLSDFGTFNLLNGVTGSAGLNFKPSTITAVGVSVNYREQYFQGLGDQYSVSPYAFWNFDAHWRVTGYGIVGLSRSSPRIGGGIRLVLFG